jgi:hypothetical protein
MAADELIFTAKNGEALEINVKPDMIEWAYQLNTSVTPTYGGEVVQILSAFVDNMTIGGQVRTYKKAEQIYNFFIARMQRATQPGEFKGQPVTMYYPEREWTFEIIPLTFAPLKYGRDVVVPEWQITAHIVQPDSGFVTQLMNDVDLKNFEKDLGGPVFGKAVGYIGWEEDDPFRSPIKDDKKRREFEKAILNGEEVRYNSSDLGDWFNGLIPSYLEGNFDDLTADFSRPAMGRSSQGQGRDGTRNSGITTAVEAVRWNRRRTGDQ